MLAYASLFRQIQSPNTVDQRFKEKQFRVQVQQWIPSDCIKRAAKQATKRAIRATKRATRAISEPCHIAMMIAAKNGVMTTATAAMTTGRKARVPGNFVDADQITPYVADQTFMSKAKYPSYICI